MGVKCRKLCVAGKLLKSESLKSLEMQVEVLQMQRVVFLVRAPAMFTEIRMTLEDRRWSKYKSLRSASPSVCG